MLISKLIKLSQMKTKKQYLFFQKNREFVNISQMIIKEKAGRKKFAVNVCFFENKLYQEKQIWIEK